jgi:bromodomain adjacent to zinc finger domain protein 1A
MCNCDPITCAVHADGVDRTVWSYYNTEEEINALIESLNVRGFREKNLREQLEANRDLIVDYIKKCPVEKLSFVNENDSDVTSKAIGLKRATNTIKKYDDTNFNCRVGADVNEIYDFVLRKYLLEFEHKISAGCLGELKVSDKMMWRKYIEDGEYYSLDDHLKWGRSSVANGSMTNGHAKVGGSSRGSEKNDDEDDGTSDSMSTIGETDFVQAMEVDSGNCSDMESVDENVQMKTSDVEAVKLKVKNLAMALLQIEQGTEIKFIRAPFGPSKESKDKSAMARAYELSKKRLLMWEESLMKATNFSQVSFTSL